MTKQKAKTNTADRILSLLENILFVCCIVIIALRTTHTEAPTPQSSQIQGVINDAVYSLAMSGSCIFLLLLLLLARLVTGRFSYKMRSIWRRPRFAACAACSLEIGLALLLIAATLATMFAPEKRAAITASLILLAPFCMALLLTQIINSHAKIKILLIAITSLGIYASWQSAQQRFVSDAIMLQAYRDDPAAMLEQLGIKRGSLNEMLLEHRLSSKGARASFTTSNSAGSFAVLACFASIALFADRLKVRKTAPASTLSLILAATAPALVIVGLVLTRSKGAIAAFLLALLVFAILSGSSRPKLSKNIILVVCVLTVLVLIPLIVWFGFKSGRLPGGNSMLVRWQYWKASAQMAADHFWTGVGPGNFDTLYHRYKPPSAIETVSDPHCFLLSILTQYGPLGLLGFLLIMLVPLWRSSLTNDIFPENRSIDDFKKLSITCILAVVAVMFLLRPFILPPSTASSLDEKIYVFANSYVTPAAVFIIGFVMLIKSLQTAGPASLSARAEAGTTGYALQNTSVAAKALFAGLFGVLIHNLIDFAIFEPGVLTTFCALLACLIALDSKNELPASNTERSMLNVRRSTFIPVIAGVLVIAFCYFNYALIPVAKSTSKIAQATRYAAIGQFPLAHNLLSAASSDDELCPDAPLKNGWLYLQHLYSPIMPPRQMLEEAELALFIAAQRNPADYKPFDTLADLYSQYAQLKPGEKDRWLKKALDSALNAVELYPGEAELHLHVAQLADEPGQNDMALKHYEKTVEIEDAFREQFHLMYPDRQIISRLLEDQYELAKQKVKVLSAKP